MMMTRRRRRRRRMRADADDVVVGGGGLDVYDDRARDIIGGGRSGRRCEGGTGGGDLTTEHAREIANDLVEIKELIQARMTSMDGTSNFGRLRSLLPEVMWMYRTGERRKRVFTRDHTRSILLCCYDVNVSFKKNVGWDVLLRELDGQCIDRPEGLLRSDVMVDNLR